MAEKSLEELEKEAWKEFEQWLDDYTEQYKAALKAFLNDPKSRKQVSMPKKSESETDRRGDTSVTEQTNAREVTRPIDS